MAEKEKKENLEQSSSMKNYAPLIHLSITGTLIVPFLFLIVSLLAYLASSNPRVQAAGREVLNFGITIILLPIFIGGVFLTIIGIPLGLLLVLLLIPYVILSFLVFPIIAAMKAADGIDFRYPLAIRFFKD